MGIEGTYLYIIKAIYDKPIANVILYDKPIANVILNGEKLKTFLQDQEQDKSAHSHQLLFNMVLEVLVTIFREEKEIKRIQLERKK